MALVAIITALFAVVVGFGRKIEPERPTTRPQSGLIVATKDSPRN